MPVFCGFANSFYIEGMLLNNMNNNELREKVRNFWNKEACGTKGIPADKFSRQYFDAIEERRYNVEPDVFSFAQFTRFYNQKVLEVGIGAGTDFLQWVRAGAKAYGIDLTQEAVEHVINRLKIYGLSAEEVRVADAEEIPYPDNSFDLVYSWGVIHHTPNTLKALDEIIRVTKVGGRIKIMIYNRHSLNAFYQHLRFGLFRFKSISWTIYHHMESLGTKAYSIKEMKKILAERPVEIKDIRAKATSYDLLWNRPPPFPFISYILAFLLGFNRIGWFMTIDLVKTN